MKRRLKAVLYTGLVLAGFVALPMLASGIVPPEIVEMMSMVGLDMQTSLNQVVLVGVLMAALAFISTDSDEWTVRHILATVGLEILGFYLALYGFGVGDPWSFGLVNRRIPFDTVELTIDFRAFIIILFLITILGIATHVLKYWHAKERRTS